jgi:hypothetical protein
VLGAKDLDAPIHLDVRAKPETKVIQFRFTEKRRVQLPASAHEQI